METTTHNPEGTKNLARNFALETLRAFDYAPAFDAPLKEPGEVRATIVGLYGELGAGKTTFVQGVAEALGIEDNVLSPTFVIERVYKLKKQRFERLIHIDCYRLRDGRELAGLGWDNLVESPRNLIMLEWPENVRDMLPERHITIKFEHISPEERRISIEVGEKGPEESDGGSFSARLP